MCRPKFKVMVGGQHVDDELAERAARQVANSVLAFVKERGGIGKTFCEDDFIRASLDLGQLLLLAIEDFRDANPQATPATLGRAIDLATTLLAPVLSGEYPFH